MRLLSTYLLLPFAALALTSAVNGDSFGFRFNAASYSGAVSESEPQVVSVSQPIRVESGDSDELVCMVSIVRHHNEPKVPFEIDLLDQKEGTVGLRSTRALSCEEQASYNFQIEAISCSGTYSERVPVNIEVSDSNEFSPTWDSDSLRVSVEEGRLVDSIVRLAARDRDCNGKICGYEIESNTAPFEVTREGVLRNTQPLNFSESHSHVLSVVATDCGMLKSVPLLVIVEVKQPCKTGWNGLTTQNNYIPSTGPQPLFPHANFDLCPEEKCVAQSYEATVRLETKHIGKGCDRDTYSLTSQRHLCGASAEAIDMLPPANQGGEDGGLRDFGTTSDQSITRFNGDTGLDSPMTSQMDLDGPAFPGNVFTVATWMKHVAPNAEPNSHVKEHILCRADDHKMNRHHFALFVRNCKLVMLLRQEYTNGEDNVFRPAEWRWKLPQVCDGEWHHYAVNVNFPDVELLVDGDRWKEEKDNPEIIDDWPLHPVQDMDTKTTIAACWQGEKGDYRHQFSGYLAGLSYLPGVNENHEVLRCLHQCAESLQTPATSSLSAGMEMVTDGKGARVVIDGPDVDDLVSLVRQVAYLNTREFPAPGRRIVSLDAKVHCIDGKTVTTSEQRSFVNVVTVPEPKIEITGTPDIGREYDDFKLGVRIFADVHIVMSTGAAGSSGEPVNGIENRLDECTVSVSPPLNSDHEKFDVPEDLLRSLKIVGKVNSEGAVFSGAEMIYNYERLLRQVTYTNKKPAYYLNRQFKIVCSEMNKRFVGNEYSQTLTVIHPAINKDQDQPKQAAHHQQPHTAHVPQNAHRRVDTHGVDQVGFERQSYIRSMSGQAHSNVVAVVAVVCVALLAVFLILGIIRVRAGHRRSSAEELQAEVEMAWDDSALNITVNPLQSSSGKRGQAVATLTENPCPVDDHGDDDDDDDGGVGDYDSLSEDDDDEEDELYEEEDDEEEDEEEEEAATACYVRDATHHQIQMPGGRSRNLEWDNNI